MRKRTSAFGALALAVAVIPATASAAITNQTLTLSVSPTKLASKGTPTPVAMTLRTAATYSDPAHDPAATLVDISLPTSLRINPKGIPTCDPGSIQNIPTSQAIAACPDSVIGSGSAIIAGVLGPPKTAVVTAFLGSAQGANPVLLLHTRVDELSVTSVLTGVVTRTPAGLKLSVTVPPLAGGHEVLTDFTSTIDRKTTIKKKVKGKTKKVKSGLLTATCPKTKVLAESAIFNFKDFTTQQTSTLNASASARCTPVKPKKKR
jgi:hypothetical protein